MQIRMTRGDFDRIAARLRETQGIALTGTAGTISKMGVGGFKVQVQHFLTREMVAYGGSI